MELELYDLCFSRAEFRFWGSWALHLMLQGLKLIKNFDFHNIRDL